MKAILSLFLSFIIVHGLAVSEEIEQKSVKITPDAGMTEEIIKHNSTVTETWDNVEVLRPYAEYEKAGYLIFSGNFSFESKEVKLTILKNLPRNVKVIVYAGSDSEAKKLDELFSSVINRDLFEVITIKLGGNGFWARDTVPVPVYVGSASSPSLGVVDAKYYHNYEPDEVIADHFDAELIEHGYYFEGGNFLADGKGNCFIVDKLETKIIFEKVFREKYGCTSLTRMPHRSGIGHIDERLKFISDKIALTDNEDYKKIMEKKGYQVELLPKPEEKYETYVNSLLINGTVFIPVFNEQTDTIAIEVYKKLGLKVVPINTKSLSNNGLGSIHCITMTYPALNN